MSKIQILNAWEGNLKNISLEIPKNKLTVFTGVSGSGKSTLLIDVLSYECQRQYLEAMSMQGIHKPKVERIRGAAPTIIISQSDSNRNPRSTVGTMTDVYTDLRMVYEKLGVRRCPYCNEMIHAGDCKEETEKIGDNFRVYMYCSECGKRMDKLTRTEFSFNTKEGACPTCEGIGKIHTIKRDEIIDETLSLEEGAVRYWEKAYGEYQSSVFYKALNYYEIPIAPKTPVKQYSELQKAILYDGVQCEAVKEAFPDKQLPKTVAAGRFEGAVSVLWRRYMDRQGEMPQFDRYFEQIICSECQGERLTKESRNVTVNGMRLPQLSAFSLEEMLDWICELKSSLPQEHFYLVEAYLRDIETKLNRYVRVGLGYLSLDRQIITLSGGELQRLRLAAVLDSDLTNVIYILDEPTKGLHSKDTQGLISILQKLRDLENTVLVIEHDPEVMAAADYLVDVGPAAGKFGGEIVAAGTLEEIRENPDSATGEFLRNPPEAKTKFRAGDGGKISIRNAGAFNLKNLDAEIPTGCLIAVTGPSGSGKSTLVFEVLAKEAESGQQEHVSGLDAFSKVINVQQAEIAKTKRSNVATYSEVYTLIRKLFAKCEEAKKAHLTEKHFSFNTPGGRCENCQGLGYVSSNMLFFADIEVTCPVCKGNQFHEEVLAVTYKGASIRDVLKMSVEEASVFFAGEKKIAKILDLLLDVGLGYLELGQTLTTLSGGESQRLKLAKELIGCPAGQKNLYLLDEPTVGLHPKDIIHFQRLIDRLTDAGNTVVVVEHNQQLIRQCDWIIDLGPEGGQKGGQLMYAGHPRTG